MTFGRVRPRPHWVNGRKREYLEKRRFLANVIRVTLIAGCIFSVVLWTSLSNRHSEDVNLYADSRFSSRSLLQSTDAGTTISANLTTEAHSEGLPWEACDFEEQNLGYLWVVIYAFLVLIIFVALAIICDDFFVPSLEVISEKLELSEDVAGATFMAAGSSAPELFTSVAGVAQETDVGIGTIVGSAVFNILIIIALSAALAGQVLHLDWRPLVRDSIFYGLSIICFIIFAWDAYFELWESIVLLVLYLFYILIMKFNSHLMRFMDKCTCMCCRTQVVPIDAETGVEGETDTTNLPAEETPVKRLDDDNNIANDKDTLPPLKKDRRMSTISMGDTGDSKHIFHHVKHGELSGKITSSLSDLRRGSAIDSRRGSAIDVRRGSSAIDVRRGSSAIDVRRGSAIDVNKSNLNKSVHNINGSANRGIESSSGGEAPPSKTLPNNGSALPPVSISNQERTIVSTDDKSHLISNNVGNVSEGIDNTGHDHDLSPHSSDPSSDPSDSKANKRPSMVVAPTAMELNNLMREAAASATVQNNIPEEKESQDGGTTSGAAEEEEVQIVVCPCLPPLNMNYPDKEEARLAGCCGWTKFVFKWMLFIVSFPFVCLFTWTIPNCSKPHLKKWYLVSFINSVLWIAMLSFAMVTIVQRTGCILHINDYAMGLVIVAIGTSIPDALSSVLVARDGFGDMAVSNAIGSNVFDINLGLGLPFVIRIAIDKGESIYLFKGDDVLINAYNNGDMIITPHAKFGFILLLILLITLVVFVSVRFHLNKYIGIIFVNMYIMFLVYAFIQEFLCEGYKC